MGGFHIRSGEGSDGNGYFVFAKFLAELADDVRTARLATFATPSGDANIEESHGFAVDVNRKGFAGVRMRTAIDEDAVAMVFLERWQVNGATQEQHIVFYHGLGFYVAATAEFLHIPLGINLLVLGHAERLRTLFPCSFFRIEVYGEPVFLAFGQDGGEVGDRLGEIEICR